MDRVRTQANERIDRGDFDAAGQFADKNLRDIGHFLGEPGMSVPAYGGANTPGCVIQPGAFVFDAPNPGDMTITATPVAPLRLLIGASDSALVGVEAYDGPPCGDFFTLTADQILTGDAPTALVPVKVVLARTTLLTAGTLATRSFKNLTPPYSPSEIPAKINTRFVRSVEWLVVDSIPLAYAQAANGFQFVAILGFGGANAWYTALPLITNVAEYPLGYIPSIKQFAQVTANELLNIKGSTLWDDAPADDLASLDSRATSLENERIRTAVRFHGDGAGGYTIVSSKNVAAIVETAAGNYSITKTAAGAGDYLMITAEADNLLLLGQYSVRGRINAASLDVLIDEWVAGAWAACDVFAGSDYYLNVIEFG